VKTVKIEKCKLKIEDLLCGDRHFKTRGVCDLNFFNCNLHFSIFNFQFAMFLRHLSF
jgi:hypothetical protein